MNLCANESALRSYLRTVDQEERRVTAIENRASQLMLTDCSDSKTDMALEALQEISEAVCDAIAVHQGHIGHKCCAVEKARHFEFIGRLVSAHLQRYCAKEATRIATHEINQASCPHCFDAGCPKCRERD